MTKYGWRNNSLIANDITIENDLSIEGDMTFGDASTDTFVCNGEFSLLGKLTSQIYHNLSGQTYTVLKIHNHDTTAEIGSLETKGEFKNTSGLCLGQANYWSYEPTGDTGAPSQLSASENIVAVDTSMTVTAGNIYGLTGQVQLYGTLNGSTVNVAGVVGIISAAGANTEVLHMAGVQSAIAGGVVNPTTGTLSHFLANTAGTVGATLIDNLLCMINSQIITNFASFNSAATDKCIEASANAMTTNNTTYCLRILVEGSPMYIPVFHTKNWA